jgi:hypothetical protein
MLGEMKIRIRVYGLREFARAAQILKYSSTKSAKKDLRESEYLSQRRKGAKVLIVKFCSELSALAPLRE